jgi:exopolysaccharide biosynthesis protein
MIKTIKYFLIIPIIALAFWGLYYILNNPSITKTKDQEMEKITQWVTEVDAEINLNLQRLRAINFDTQALQSTEYKSLNNTEIILRNQPPGHINIFVSPIYTVQSAQPQTDTQSEPE